MADLVVKFEIDDWRQGPTMSSNNFDSDGRDRLKHLFELLSAPDNLDLFRGFLERQSFSWWSSSGVVRASPDGVTIWAHDESAPDDFVLLSRAQFKSLLTDWALFTVDLVPFTRTYDDRPGC